MVSRFRFSREGGAAPAHADTFAVRPERAARPSIEDHRLRGNVDLPGLLKGDLERGQSPGAVSHGPPEADDAPVMLVFLPQ
jgi:hypothetical protein